MSDQITPAVWRKLLRTSFMHFLAKAWPRVDAGKRLAMNWHLLALGLALDRVVTGKSKRLLVNLPPRNGKSLTISVIWIAWMLGVDPTLRFIGISYSNELSGKFARDCLAIMESEWYRAIFPETIISRKRSAAHDFETTRGGGRIATSVGGTLTGRGGDIIVLDDMIKPEEVNSIVARERLNDWYRGTLSSRLDDKQKGAQIFVTQRLHQYDLSGLLLETASWDHLCLPAYAAEDTKIPLIGGRIYFWKKDEVLHPAREPLSALMEVRANMGSAGFQAQYLQDPVPAEGNIYKAKWLRYYPLNFDVHAEGQVIQSWDTGIKTGDSNSYSVCITARQRRNEIYMIDVWRGRLEFPDLERKVVELANLHRAHTLLIEDKASGQELIQNLRSKQYRGVPMPIPRSPVQDKQARASAVTSMVEAGQLFLPEEASWLAEFNSELLAFPSGRFDDQVDALTQLLTWVRDGSMFTRPIIEGPEEMPEDGTDIDYRYDPSNDPWGA